MKNRGDKQTEDPLRGLFDRKILADEVSRVIEGNDCPADKELLAYVRKELPEAERIEVKGHIHACSRCRQRENQLERETPGEGDEARREAKVRGLRIEPLAPGPKRIVGLPIPVVVIVILAIALAAAEYFLLPSGK